MRVFLLLFVVIVFFVFFSLSDDSTGTITIDSHHVKRNRKYLSHINNNNNNENLGRSLLLNDNKTKNKNGSNDGSNSNSKERLSRDPLSVAYTRTAKLVYLPVETPVINVTGLYKGLWKLEVTQQQQFQQNKSVFINEDTGTPNWVEKNDGHVVTKDVFSFATTNEKNKNNVFYRPSGNFDDLKLQKREGIAYLQLYQRNIVNINNLRGTTTTTKKSSSLSKFPQIVDGSLVIRDGIYGTDKFLGYIIMGVLHPDSNLVLWAMPSNLILLPTEDEIFTVARGDNTTASFFIASVLELLTERAARLSKAFVSGNNGKAVSTSTSGSSTLATAATNTRSGTSVTSSSSNNNNGGATSDSGMNIVGGSCTFIATFSASALKSEKIKIDEKTGEIYQYPVKLNGGLSSQNCQTQLELNVEPYDLDVYFGKMVNFEVLFILVSLIELVVTVGQIDYAATPAAASKVSLLTMGELTIIDVYLCFIHIMGSGVSSIIFNSFIIAAFLKFLIFSIFEMRYLMLIWRSRHSQLFAEGSRTAQIQSLVLYADFYLCLLGSYYLIVQIHSRFTFAVAAFIFYSFWIPQIISNVQKDCRNALTHRYIICITIAKLTPLYYFLGCPYNFLSIETDTWILKWMTAYVVGQVIILISQDIVNPRFFIPARFLPVKYNYFRPFVGVAINNECTICMSTIENNDTNIMLTPCNHIFHSACLEPWMEIKYECPVCRATLPPL